MSDKTEDGMPIPAGPIYAPGDGKVLRIGWAEADEYGTSGFRATIEFPAGPPEIPFSVIWQGIPVVILVKSATPPSSR